VKIEKIETIRVAEHPNLLWVEVTTDDGVVGLGETFFGAMAVEAYLHETAAPILIGRDPLEIEGLGKSLSGYLGFNDAGAETRGASAIDIALWDIFGKVTDQPIAQLLGGFARRQIRTYNTCAGVAYMKQAVGQKVSNYGRGGANERYADLDAFLNRADDLAEDLLSEGLTAMKIWPFDAAAEATGGQYIDRVALKEALSPFEKIRKRVGDRMEIMVEFHSMWQLLPAIEIARSLAPYRTFWHEDPIRMDSLADLKRYADASPAPLCASETLATRWRFKDLLLTGAAGVVMLDLSWCGGVTEAKKIAGMAEAWRLPIAPHDCTGPVVLCASTHLSLNAPNAIMQESVRAFYRTWYRDLVTVLPEVKDGMIAAPPGPGHGASLHPDLDRRFSVARRSTIAE
jgi:galactonate dehydratase